MSTVKISQLPNLTRLDSNTSNTILVGIDNSTSVTSQFTAKTLAESLYSNTALNVGNNAIILPNVIAQFVGNSSAYLQTNLQNKTPSGSADHVITADVGTDEKDYIDLGIHGSTSSDAIFTSILPLDGYLYVQGNTATGTGGNLIMGTTTAGRTVNIIAGGPGSDKLQVKISTDGVNLVAKPLKFADGSSQNTSMESAGTFANGAFVKANSGFTLANSASLYANGAFDTANSASVFANGAFGASNSASSYANSAFIRANAVFSQSNNQVWPQANAAFEAANSAALYANGSFIQANAVFSRANNQIWPQANAAFDAANSVSLYANAAFIQANAAFIQANVAVNSSNIVGVYANAAFGATNSVSSYANSAFTAANTATSASLYANGAFGAANSAGVFANGAFINSNNAYTTANSAGTYANGAFGAANSVSQYANAAFTKANTAQVLAGTQAGRLDIIEPIAQEAFTIAYSALDLSTANSGAWLPLTANSAAIFANGAFGAANSAGVFANGSFGAANSASLYANGAFEASNSASSYANSGFGVANSASLYANGAFIQANAVFSRSNNQVWPQANAAFDAANSASLYANGAFTAANVATSAALYANGAFDAANSASVFANGAFIISNNAYTTANSGGLYANGAFGAANSAGQYANAAFSKANSALQNTSGTFDGTMYIAGGLSVNGTVLFANSNFSATESVVTISASPTVATPSNDGYMIHISGKNGVPARVVTDSYGTNAYALFAGRAARGNVAVPTAIQTGDVLARFSGNGYGTTKYQPLGVGRIEFIAAENFTDANTGSQIQFWNCPVGSNTLTNIATFNGNSVIVTGVIEPQKGFIYTPRVPAGNQTTIAIDYATDSMIKANLVADLTVSHSNFIAGKVVEVWLVNTGGVGRTVTHGLTATNSTTNSTTFTIAGTSSAHLKFFSIDGDLANTFASIVFA